jgi:hypothetical protein
LSLGPDPDGITIKATVSILSRTDANRAGSSIFYNCSSPGIDERQHTFEDRIVFDTGLNLTVCPKVLHLKTTREKDVRKKATRAKQKKRRQQQQGNFT